MSFRKRKRAVCGLCRLCLGLTSLSLSLPLARAADFSVTYAGGSAYAINGTGGNPTLTLVRGRTYTFALNTTSSHPFRINSAGAPSSGMFTGTISYTVPTNVANYTYRCTIHGFGGDILTVAPPPPPVVRIVDVSVGTNIVLRSTGTNTWTVFPEYRTNVTQTNWFALTVQTNRFANGTNETFCGKPPGDSVFIRIRAQEN